MKKKQIIYFLLIIVGAMIMGFGEVYVRKEYAFALGIIILMFGVYKSSTSWATQDQETKEEEHEF
jgi:cadmium resistance protein CadD (predicted permease)